MVVDDRSGVRVRSVRPRRLRTFRGGRARAPRLTVDVVSAIDGGLLPREAAREAGTPVVPRLGGGLGAARDRFLGLVSHELRTPVTTIYGNAQLLAGRGGLGVAERQMADDIAEESERLLGLVDNLLILARIEAGTPPYVEPILLPHEVRGVCRAQPAWQARDVTVEVRGDHDVSVEADRAYLEVLLANLLRNAVAYSEPGTPIRVVLEATPDAAIVRVLDRGIGLGREALSHFAEPFFRGPRASRMVSGMGIGLTVCQRVADAHGGRLWARPRVGGGAEVTFVLPRLVDPDAVSDG